MTTLINGQTLTIDTTWLVYNPTSHSYDTITGSTITSGNLVNTYLGGITAVDGTIINGGIALVNSGGVANSTIVNSGAEYIEDGGVANNTTLNSGGSEYVSAGGISNNVTVNSGGIEIVFGSGVVNGGNINSGGSLIFDITTSTLDSFHSLTINSGAIIGIGIGSGVSISGFEVVSGAKETIHSGGVASNTTVDSGGWEVVESGGTANGGIINSGGGLGFDVTTSTLASFNSLQINRGAILSVTVDTGISIAGLDIVSGGNLNVYGTVNNTTIDSGGTETINFTSGIFNGVASGSIVNFGGREVVFAGGMEIGGTVNSGGELDYDITISNLDAFNSIHINSGAILRVDVESGVSVSGLMIANGGNAYIHSGGIGNSTTVNSGGWEYVSAGGAENQGILSSGGTITFNGAAGTDSSVTFNGGGLLKLDAPSHFAAPIAGFDIHSKIDLTTIADVTQINWNNGNLAIAEANGQVINLALLGNYKNSVFVKSSDHSRGTLISLGSAPSGGTVATFLGNLTGIDPTGFSITDTATNVVAALNSSLLVNVAKISNITLTDAGTPNLAITAAQFVQDTKVLGKISTPYTLTINGETAANLAIDIKNSHVAGVAINDSAAHVLALLNTVLQPNVGKISGITLTDTSTPNLAITAAQFVQDTKVLGKISTPYTLTINGETAANLAIDIKNSHVSKIGIVDSAAHIRANLAVLQGNAGKLSGITLTDKVAPTFSLTAVQTTANLGALNSVQSPYWLSVKDTVANLNKFSLAGVHTSLIEIMPTSLLATLVEKTPISNLNLSLIKLTGYSINEKVYHGTGTEIDIIDSHGALAHQLILTNTSESQLHLLGVGSTLVHVI